MTLIDDVVKIFMDVKVNEVPTYDEIHEEFELLTDNYIYDYMIAEVEKKIAILLHEKCPHDPNNPTLNVHLKAMQIRWFSRGYKHEDESLNLIFAT
jgi:hypothetical protein